MSFVKLFSAICLVSFGFVFPAYAVKPKCDFSSEKHLIYIVPSDKVAFENGSKSRLWELVKIIADPGKLDFSFAIIEGETGNEVFSCGVGKAKKYKNTVWREKFISKQTVEKVQFYIANLQATNDNLNMLEAIEAASNAMIVGKKNLVIIDASLAFVDDQLPEFTMETQYGSDGLFAGSRTESPFAVAGRESRLQDGVFYVVESSEDKLSPLLAAGLQGFWAKYIKLQGGTIGGLEWRTSQSIRNALLGKKSKEIWGEVDLSQKPRLITPKPMQLSEFELAPASKVKSVSCYDRSAPTIGNLRMLLVWNGRSVDLDLRSFINGPEIYFKRTKTIEGFFEKTDDFIRAGGFRKYEAIEYSNPVRLNDVNVDVNLYEVQEKITEPINAELRVTYGDACRSIPVRIEAEAGDKGANSRHRINNPHWAKIDLASAF